MHHHGGTMQINQPNPIQQALRQPDALRGLDRLVERVSQIVNARKRPAKVENSRAVEIEAKTA
jgi:hypothetical protein